MEDKGETTFLVLLSLPTSDPEPKQSVPTFDPEPNSLFLHHNTVNLKNLILIMCDLLKYFPRR